MTESVVEEAFEILKRALSPLGTEVELMKEELSEEEFKKDPIISNTVFINGRPLEDWLGGSTSSSECCEVCGDEDCRTVIIGGKEHEVVPSQLIVDAGMKAANIPDESVRHSELKSCC